MATRQVRRPRYFFKILDNVVTAKMVHTAISAAQLMSAS